VQVNNTTPHSEILRFKAHVKEQTEIVLAFSGGLDSMVLLHLLAEEPQLAPKLRAIYIDHQLQTESKQWAKHCKTICSNLGVPFQSITVDIENRTRSGLESRARKARYQALYAKLDSNSLLLTAHHQRDQAETFLLNLQRGSGVAGLAAMPYLKPLTLASGSTAYHVRPLLSVPHTSLLDYARHHQLEWIEDPSNQDLRFTRNNIRHQLLPAFEQACSNIQSQIERSANHQSEALQLLQRLAQQDIKSGDYSQLYIDLASYQSLDWPSLKNVITFWAKSHLNLRLNFDQLIWIKTYSRNAPSSSASLKLREGELRFYRTKLYYVADKPQDYQFKLSHFQSFSNKESVDHAHKLFALTLPLSWYQSHLNDLSVRSISPDDKPHNKRLKKWFQQRGVPTWQRQQWPVLCLNDKPVLLWGTQGIFESNERALLDGLLCDQTNSREQIVFLLEEAQIVALSHK